MNSIKNNCLKSAESYLEKALLKLDSLHAHGMDASDLELLHKAAVMALAASDLIVEARNELSKELGLSPRSHPQGIGTTEPVAGSGISAGAYSSNYRDSYHYVDEG